MILSILIKHFKKFGGLLMTIEIETISSMEKNKILSIIESHFLDAKSKMIKPGKLTKTISAFANADGGEIYIGISEIESVGISKMVWEGFADIEDANGHLQVFEELFPLGQYFNYTFLSESDSPGIILRVEVLRSKDIIIASDGIPYIRRGAQSLPVNSDEKMQRLRFDKGITSFEIETLETEIERITESDITKQYLPPIAPMQEPSKWFRKQVLSRGDKPTVSGVLLFDDIPQAILPKRCGIKILRYKTSEAQRDSLAFDPLTIEGCIYEQIRDAVRKTIEIVESIEVLGPQGFSKVEYPVVTLHEIITNAVLHRDYSIPTDIQIRIFDNRIEIESPGKLPGHITEHNILEEQFARNGTIVRIINKFPEPPNKDVGEGLDSAFEAMVNLRLKEPIIKENPNSVLVLIRHETLDSPATIIEEYLRYHDEINNTRAREICHIGSENIVKRIFEKMISNSIIERIPERKGRATAYRLIGEK